MSNFILSILSLGIFFQSIFSSRHEDTSGSEIYKPYRTIMITSVSNVKGIEIPTSDGPLMTWMEIWKGIFPNVTSDTRSSLVNISIGDPVTLFIFYRDISDLYDINVTDCWAYDDENFPLSKYKLRVTEDPSNITSKHLLSTWKRVRSKEFLKFLYASFMAFKFPEKDRIYLSCDIQLIGKKQKNQKSYYKYNK